MNERMTASRLLVVCLNSNVIVFGSGKSMPINDANYKDLEYSEKITQRNIFT